jgi:hypothetical protein
MSCPNPALRSLLALIATALLCVPIVPGLTDASRVRAEGGVQIQALPINPRATYLLTHDDPGALPAVSIDLAALGLQPGDEVVLQTNGDFCLSIYQDCATSEGEHPMIGAFSGSSTLLSSDVLNRVADAIAAGTPIVTYPTLFGGVTTDIPEDFAIEHAPSSTRVTIPPARSICSWRFTIHITATTTIPMAIWLSASASRPQGVSWPCIPAIPRGSPGRRRARQRRSVREAHGPVSARSSS